MLGLLAASVLAEIGFRTVEATPLRFVLPASEIAMYGPDHFVGYRHRPGARGMWLTERRADVTISGLGLRDRERIARRENDQRVVVVGDSLLEAVQVPLDRTAVAIAEKRVAAKRPGAEVINLGLAGATPPVLTARLQSLVHALEPDLAIVVVNVGDFLSPTLRDDTAFVGYRTSPDGSVNLSHGFREGRGYQLRTSAIGAAFYWLLDHLALARVLNSRKNVGFLAEWPQAPQPKTIGDDCASARTHLISLLSLWRDAMPKAASAVIDAFARDIAAIDRSGKPSVLIAVRGYPMPCSVDDKLREDLAMAVHDKFGALGLVSHDLDGLMAQHFASSDRSALRGFGRRMGHGHFNEKGNEVLGNALADILLDRK